MQAERVCPLLFRAVESLPFWQMQLVTGWVAITQQCSAQHHWNLSSNGTCLLHSVQVSQLQSSKGLAHLLSGGELDSRVAPRSLGEPARGHAGLWDAGGYLSVNAGTTVCNISKLSENLWLLIRSLSLQTSSPASDSFLFQPIYLL